MNTIKDTIRLFIESLLRGKNDTVGFKDSDSLFISSRLDSLSAMETVVFLEEKFSVDFSDTGFDLELIDSIDAMAALIESSQTH